MYSSKKPVSGKRKQEISERWAKVEFASCGFQLTSFRVNSPNLFDLFLFILGCIEGGGREVLWGVLPHTQVGVILKG